ncbi:MAG: hypothetical protein JJU19_09185 [Pararhodobacter sp.]|nr:hypothetical protein [Pararhodobacter sp.]
MLSRHVVCALVVSVLLVIAGHLTMTVGSDLSVAIGRDGQSDLVIFGVYLPHAVRVLAAYLFSWWALAYQIPAMIWHFLVVGTYPLNTASLFLVLAFSMSAPLVFSMLKYMGFDIHGMNRLRANWRPLLLVGFLASLMNAVVLFTVMGSRMAADDHMLLMLTMIAGDVAGLIVGMLMLVFLFRIYERIIMLRSR